MKEIYQPNQDAGFRVDPSERLRYGLRHTRAAFVSKKDIVCDRPDKFASKKVGAPPEPSVPVDHDLHYSVRLLLDESRMQTGNRPLRSRPRKTVTVGNDAGEWRIIACLMSAVLRYPLEKAREG